MRIRHNIDRIRHKNIKCASFKIETYFLNTTQTNFIYYIILLSPANIVYEGYVFTGVCLSIGDLPARSPLAGRSPQQGDPPAGRPPWQGDPLARRPPGKETPWQGDPPARRPPWQGGPQQGDPQQGNSPSKEAPLARRPSAGSPPVVRSPCKETPQQGGPHQGDPLARRPPKQGDPLLTEHAGRYSQCTGSTHPTRMQSCIIIFFSYLLAQIPRHIL